MSEVPLYSAQEERYRGTSQMRKCTPLGPYRRPMPRVPGGSQGGGRFLMGEVPHVQGCLAHEELQPPRTLQEA